MKTKKLNRKLSKLREDLGEELYNSLDRESKIFMAKTCGSIYLGKNVDIDLIYKWIREHDFE